MIRFRTKIPAAIAALTLGILVTGLSTSASLASRPTSSGRVNATINVGEKNFPEEEIVAAMYQLRLQKAGFKVAVHQIAETPALQQAMLRGQIDMYPEYTGTGLLVLHPNSTKIVTNPIVAYDSVKTGYQKRFHFTWLEQAPMNDTNGVAVTKAIARKYHLTDLSRLTKVAGKLTFAEDPACTDRMDCLNGMAHAYHIHFKTVTPVSSGALRYTAITQGKYDVIEVFTTDPQIRTDHLVVLADNKHKVFPADHIAPIVRDSVLNKYRKQIKKALNPIAPLLATKVMIKLNGKVGLNHQDPTAVARSFLKAHKLL